MSRVLDGLKVADALPLGHYGRVEAKAAVDREYQTCRQMVAHIRGHLTPAEAAQMCAQVCEALRLPKVKRIVLCSPDVHDFAEAHYCRREIHFRTEWIGRGTLVHELAHHVAREGGFRDGRHGQGFCEALGLVLACIG